MTFVAYLRVRQRLVIFLAIVVAIAALNTLSVLFGHGVRHGSEFSIGWSSEPMSGSGRSVLQEVLANVRLPLAFGFAIAAGFTLFFATFATGSLNGLRESLHLAFTRPLAREAVALRFFAVDVVALVACFVAICLVIVFELAVFGIGSHVYADAAALPTLAFGFGIAFMYYGIVQAATAWQRRSAGAVVGGLWAAFILASNVTTTPFGPLVNAIVAAVRVFDPLVYLSQLIGAIGHPAPFAADAFPTLAVWAIGAACCAIATLSWKRLEV